MAFSDHLLKLEHWHLIHTDRFKLCYLPIAAVLSRNEMWSPFPTVFLRYSIIIIYYDTSVFIIKSWPPGLCPQDCIYIYKHLHCHFSHALMFFLHLSGVCVRKRRWKQRRRRRAASQRCWPPGWERSCCRRAVCEADHRTEGTGAAGAASHRAVGTASCSESYWTRTHTHIRTYTHTHRDRKEVRLFVYLCRGTECYVFTLFCVVSVLYVSYSWYASLSVARPGTVNFAPKTQTKCKCPEALMWGFLLPLKIKWVILKLIPRWLRTPLVSTFSLLLGSGLLVAKKNTRQNLGTNEWIYLIFKSVNDIFFPCKIIGILPSPVAPRQLFPQPPYCSSCDSYCLQHNR